MPPSQLRRLVRTLRRSFPGRERARFASTVAATVSSPPTRGPMWSHRINQIYPLVSLAVDEFPSDVVLDVLSGGIRSLPLGSDLLRLCASSGVETRQRGTRDGSREAADRNDAWESLHSWLLKVGVYRREDGVKYPRVLWGKARSDRHVWYGAYGLNFRPTTEGWRDSASDSVRGPQVTMGRSPGRRLGKLGWIFCVPNPESLKNTFHERSNGFLRWLL